MRDQNTCAPAAWSHDIRGNHASAAHEAAKPRGFSLSNEVSCPRCSCRLRCRPMQTLRTDSTTSCSFHATSGALHILLAGGIISVLIQQFVRNSACLMRSTPSSCSTKRISTLLSASATISHWQQLQAYAVLSMSVQALGSTAIELQSSMPARPSYMPLTYRCI